MWLSPIQVTLLPITDAQNEFAKKVYKMLKAEGIRVEIDEKSATLQAKIRDATLQKIPILGIIGPKEVESESISARTRDGKDLGLLKFSDFIKRVKDEIDKKI